MVIQEKRVLAARLKSFVLIFCFSVMLLLYIVIVIEQEDEIYRSPNRSPNISHEHSVQENNVNNQDLTTRKSTIAIYQTKNATVKRNNLENYSKTKLPVQYTFFYLGTIGCQTCCKTFPGSNSNKVLRMIHYYTLSIDKI